jgi:Ca-activated chloride channel family protein
VPEGFVGRCLLLTDGLANRGLTDPATLQAHASGLRARGVVTSAFGVGADFDERFLQGLAAAGGGHFYFIEAAASIPVVVGREMGEVLEVVLHQASVEVETRRCLVDPIAPLGLRVEGTKVHLDLGDLVSGQEVEVLFALRCAPREGDPDAWLSARVVAREGAATAALERRVARTRDAASLPARSDPEVAVPVAAAWGAQARLEALPLNQHGDTAAALAVLAKYAQRIRGEFPLVPGALAHAQALEQEMSAYANPMPAMDLKRRHFASSNVLCSRSPEGFSRRS